MGGDEAKTAAALVGLWNEWETQIAVVVSLGLQVALLLFAGVRRYSRSRILQMLLWLAFMLADVVATFAMGLISTSITYRSSSPHQQLMPFWAPFLLLHLGGQDTITAFSLEDNQLWLRHLFNMSVQVAAAGYVLYKYATTGGRLILAASLVIAAGLLRYGERVWALKRASSKEDAPWCYVQQGVISKWRPLRCHGNCPLEDILSGCTTGGHFGMYQRLVLGAHYMIYWFNPVLQGNHTQGVDEVFRYNNMKGMDLWVENPSSSSCQKKDLEEARQPSSPRRTEDIYKAIELELQLIYERVYTKAPVTHTWYGICIRAFCLFATLNSLQIFLRASKRGYTVPDIAVSYVLLIGAAALEITSALRELGSTWTFWLFNPSVWPRLKWIVRAILFVRYHLVRDGKWSNSIGQCNLIFACTAAFYQTNKIKTMEKLKKIARWLFGAPRHVKLSTAVKQLVLRKIQADVQRSKYCEADWVSGCLPVNCRDEDERELLGWSYECSFEESLIVWHMATDVFLHFLKPSDAKEREKAEAIAALSGYMMYLLALLPDSLPAGTHAAHVQGHTIGSFEEACAKYKKRNETREQGG